MRLRVQAEATEDFEESRLLGARRSRPAFDDGEHAHGKRPLQTSQRNAQRGRRRRGGSYVWDIWINKRSNSRLTYAPRFLDLVKDLTERWFMTLIEPLNLPIGGIQAEPGTPTDELIDIAYGSVIRESTREIESLAAAGSYGNSQASTHCIYCCPQFLFEPHAFLSF